LLFFTSHILQIFDGPCPISYVDSRLIEGNLTVAADPIFGGGEFRVVGPHDAYGFNVDHHNATLRSAGEVHVEAAPSLRLNDRGHNVTVLAGDGANLHGGSGGSVVVQGGAGRGQARFGSVGHGGNVELKGGLAAEGRGGDVKLSAGSSASGAGGNVVVASGAGPAASGALTLSSADGLGVSTSGNVLLLTGTTSTGASGDVLVSSGGSSYGKVGRLLLTVGSSGSGSGSAVRIVGGSAKALTGGAVVIMSGHSTASSSGTIALKVRMHRPDCFRLDPPPRRRSTGTL
jgi:hypothetical protein